MNICSYVQILKCHNVTEIIGIVLQLFLENPKTENFNQTRFRVFTHSNKVRRVGRGGGGGSDFPCARR